MKYHLRQSTRLGNRDVNEDRIGVAESDAAVLMVVADGMGGYRGGKIASRALVNRMVQQFKRHQFPVEDPRAYLKDLVSDAHLAVIKAGNEQSPPIEPRTTCVICLVQNGSAWWAHVGDSRLYWLRAGKVLERTVDHSKIEEMRRKGELTEKEMENHPQRHLVTRCIGFQHLPPIPAVSEGADLKAGDTLLLCSDGLWGPLSDDVIGSTIFDNTMEQAVETLAYQAEFKAYPNSDNISLVSFQWISERTEDKQLPSVSDETGPDESDEQVEQTMNELDDALGKS
ncbi:PP2C family protein-serine/threonine phosphatase [Kaarinaea lacus]